MNELYRDTNIINGKANLYNLSEWNKIYSRSNEDIERLFSKLDLKNKNVLTVLSSSDYLFSILIDNAKSIDTFDINPLTLRYYYLRKWLLENNSIDASSVEYDTLRQIVKSNLNNPDKYVRETAEFWDSYFDENRFYRLYSQTIFDKSEKPLLTVYAKKLDELNTRLKSYDITFYNIDITGKYSLDKKYDIILLSNILDYCKTEGQLEEAKQNLYSLLNENGEVISVHMLKYYISLKNQIRIFKSMFEYEKLFFKPYLDDAGIKKGFTYYKYIKR